MRNLLKYTIGLPILVGFTIGWGVLMIIFFIAFSVCFVLGKEDGDKGLFSYYFDNLCEFWKPIRRG